MISILSDFWSDWLGNGVINIDFLGLVNIDNAMLVDLLTLSSIILILVFACWVIYRIVAFFIDIIGAW